jgi:uracil-DNA glycosylase
LTEAERDFDAERGRLIREVRQRLESLQRAGATNLPRVEFEAPAVVAVAVREEPAAVAVVERPPTPARRPIETVAPPKPTPPSPPKKASPSPAPLSVLPTRSLFDESGLNAPAIPLEERPALLASLAAQVAECRKCPHLAATRTQTVFADGSPTARLMFIGEAPGADEDRTGVPFVGKAGQLLTDMITKGMGLARQDVYIANILKCRPPENRDPTPEESANCFPYLERQIEIVRPEFICLLGRIATSTLLNTALSMSRLRGKWHRVHGVPTVATYHPAYLLRNPAAKKDAWEDLQMLMRAMGIAIPKRKGQAE